MDKYPKQAKLYAPFVRVDLSFIEVRQKYINNEDKFCKRAKRTQDIFSFDETTAVFHSFYDTYGTDNYGKSK